MATMGRYCKAYPVDRFQEFPGWPRHLPVQADVPEEDRYYFLQENHTVTKDIFLEDVVFGDITDEWRRFCRETLTFEVPEDIPEAPAQAAAEPRDAEPATAEAASR
jgi:hypothetical protein